MENSVSLLFQDPLGIAIQKALGIGLGFNFDHMTNLKKGEVPSTRRLQAGAAKSALYKAQQLYDAKEAQKELDQFDDIIERNQKAEQMRNKIDEEIQYLAQRLTDLIPTDLSLDNGHDTKIQQYDSNNYERTSSNEYVVRTRRTATSQSIQGLLSSGHQNQDIENFDKTKTSYNDLDYLNPFGAINTTTSTEHFEVEGGDNRSSSSDKTEIEFIEEWLSHQRMKSKQQQLNRPTYETNLLDDKNRNDNEEDIVETFLA